MATNTILQHQSKPFVKRLDLSKASLATVMQNYTKLPELFKAHSEPLLASPETEALWFYLQNHAMALIAQKVDPVAPLREYAQWVDRYHSDMRVKALRMFYYLMLIGIRESRHSKSGSKETKLYVKYPDLKAHHKAVKSTAQDALISNAPQVTLGRYTEFLYDVFMMSSYSSSFGGKKWAACMKPLKDFVAGKLSMEMLMDTAFTLCHNTGPIFNKPFLYNNQDTKALQKILDVQRSGQIPQLVSEGGHEITPDMKEYVESVADQFAGFKGNVDWYLVEKLGALGTYHSEQMSQIVKSSADSEKAKKIKKFEKLLEVKKQAAENKKFAEEHIEIMPNVYVKKATRAEVAVVA